MEIHDGQTGRSYFSKRLHRFDEDKLPRELTFSCFRRFPFLSKDRTREWFVVALEKQRTKWPVDLWARVLMPEHVHLLIAPRQPKVKVGLFVGAIKEEVARQGIRWISKHSPEWLKKITVQEGSRTRRRFWQPGGGYDRSVDTLTTLQSMIDYIHQNPVRRGLVTRVEDWEWSSARWYAGMRPVWLEMDRSLPMLFE